jgi:hypothetical protein
VTQRAAVATRGVLKATTANGYPTPPFIPPIPPLATVDPLIVSAVSKCGVKSYWGGSPIAVEWVVPRDTLGREKLRGSRSPKKNAGVRIVRSVLEPRVVGIIRGRWKKVG